FTCRESFKLVINYTDLQFAKDLQTYKPYKGISMSAGSGTAAASTKKAGWLPVSLPSLSLPKQAANFCWNACTGAFKCLKDRFQVPAKPIGPKRAEVLTRQVALVPKGKAAAVRHSCTLGRPAMVAMACVVAVCALE